MGIGGDVCRRHLGQRDVDAFVAVPVFLPRHVGIVRVREAGDVQERAPIIGTGRIVQRAHGVEADLVVEQQLVGDFGHAGAGDALHVVIPPVDALVGLAPVRRPAEVRRIDVRRAAFLEAMQLVGADEMHLAGQHRAIAGCAGVVRKGRDRAGEIGGVVVAAGG